MIDSSKLDTLDIVKASFLVKNKDKKSYFFEKTFLLADISIYVTLRMHFFTFNNIQFDFIS